MDLNVCVSLIVLVDTIVLTTGLYNAALFKPAVQSSDYAPYFAYLGVDGNNDDNMTNGHCQHTWNETMPWWMVDLRGQFVVDTIILTNRGDLGSKYYHKMQNFTIDIFQEDPRKISNFPKIKGDFCYSQTDILYNGTYTYKCPTAIVGRYVRFLKNIYGLGRLDHWSIERCPVQAYCTDFKISTLCVYLGVDSNMDDNMTRGHCQHTLLETMPWWIVDLRGQFVVETITLTIRIGGFKFGKSQRKL